MHPLDFEKVAEKILRNVATHNLNPAEALIRTSISRAYFGQYLNIEKILLKKGYMPPERDRHKNLRIELLNRKQTRISQKLRDLHDIRRIADYDLNKSIILKDGIFAIALAKQIETLSKSL